MLYKMSENVVVEIKTKPKRKAYVTNEQLLKELRIYKETGKYTEEFGKYVLMIARRYASKPNYSGYTYIQDMISESVLTVIKYVKSFDETKSSNAFAYITQIIHNSFSAQLNKEKRISQTKQKLFQDHIEDTCKLEKFECEFYSED